MKNSWLIISGVLCMTAYLLASCNSDAEVKMTYAMRKQVDTVVIAQKEILNEVYDSVCTVKTDSLIKVAYDSILLERLRQMEKIRGDVQN